MTVPLLNNLAGVSCLLVPVVFRLSSLQGLRGISQPSVLGISGPGANVDFNEQLWTILGLEASCS